MAAVSIDEVWRRIEISSGEPFSTVTGKRFTYEVEGNAVRVDRTTHELHRGNFEKALELVPLSGPGEISNLVRGSAYVWAIPHDRRVPKGDW